jgi:hypothetical protein
VLLEPRKGTQGREMNRKPRIALALALAVFLSASAPVAACAGSPLLSGYGGPGAGEQALIGSSLLGRHGGGGSNRSSGPTGSGAASLDGSGRALGGSSRASGVPSGTLRGGGTRSNAHPAGHARAGSAGGPSSARGGVGGSRAAQTGGGAGAQVGQASRNAFVYPSSLRLASADSPALGISGGDLLLLLTTVAALALIGTLTIRLARLQR